MRITLVQGGCRISGGESAHTFTWLNLKYASHVKYLFFSLGIHVRKLWGSITWENMPSPQVASSKSTEFTCTLKVHATFTKCVTQFNACMLNWKECWFCCVNLSKHSCSVVYFSFYGGSEDLSDDITQQQLLPGVKYEKKNNVLIKHTELSIS